MSVFGVEWTNPPEKVYQALMTHPKFVENFSNVPRKSCRSSTRIFTREKLQKDSSLQLEHAKKCGIHLSLFVKAKCDP